MPELTGKFVIDNEFAQLSVYIGRIERCGATFEKLSSGATDSQGGHKEVEHLVVRYNEGLNSKVIEPIVTKPLPKNFNFPYGLICPPHSYYNKRRFLHYPFAIPFHFSSPCNCGSSPFLPYLDTS